MKFQKLPILLPAVIILLSLACNKKPHTTDPVKANDTSSNNNNNNNNHDSNNVAYTYYLYTDSTLSLKYNGTANMAVSLQPDSSGKKEHIHLSITGLPKGVTATFDANDVYAPYTVNITLDAVAADSGSFNLLLTATGDSSKLVRQKMIQLIVTGTCANRLAGSYNISECSGFPPRPGTVTETSPNVITFMLNDGHALTSIYATLDCNTDSLATAPSGLIPACKGTFTDSTITLYNSGGCVYYLKR